MLAPHELFLLRLELLDLAVEPLELLLDGGLALQRLAGEVLASLRNRLARLRVELDDVLLERLRLQLQTLLGRDHVCDSAFHVLE